MNIKCFFNHDYKIIKCERYLKDILLLNIRNYPITKITKICRKCSKIKRIEIEGHYKLKDFKHFNEV